MINKTLDVINTFQKDKSKSKMSVFRFMEQLHGYDYAIVNYLVDSAIHGNALAIKILCNVLNNSYDKETKKMIKKYSKTIER